LLSNSTSLLEVEGAVEVVVVAAAVAEEEAEEVVAVGVAVAVMEEVVEVEETRLPCCYPHHSPGGWLCSNRSGMMAR
jgi:hypothetical protein